MPKFIIINKIHTRFDTKKEAKTYLKNSGLSDDYHEILEIKEKKTVAVDASIGKECNEVIKAFEVVNPMIRRLYAMKTQRDAADRLLKQFGMEKLIEMILSLQQINTMPFAPKAITPLQFESKIGLIMAFVAQERAKQGTNKPIGISF